MNNKSHPLGKPRANSRVGLNRLHDRVLLLGHFNYYGSLGRLSVTGSSELAKSFAQAESESPIPHMEAHGETD